MLLKLTATAAGMRLAELASELLGLGIVDLPPGRSPVRLLADVPARVRVCGGGGGCDEILHDVIAAQALRHRPSLIAGDCAGADRLTVASDCRAR